MDYSDNPGDNHKRQCHRKERDRELAIEYPFAHLLAGRGMAERTGRCRCGIQKNRPSYDKDLEYSGFHVCSEARRGFLRSKIAKAVTLAFNHLDSSRRHRSDAFQQVCFIDVLFLHRVLAPGEAHAPCDKCLHL